EQDSFSIKALNNSVKQTKKMTAMINGFLNVSRLEAGKMYVDKQRFDMAILMKETEAETLAMTTSHKFIFEPVKETFVLADREKISHVISNFLSNAVKYSKPGSTVRVACVTVDGQAQVNVTDEGIGIEIDDLSRLFTRYYRVITNNHVSGFGIGLYLSAEIINRHDGKIWAESKPDRGSTFYFRLPVAE
ncbi:MAG: HAMP domain-containing histidine kinase, partial [Bacteroidota bacterium]|nr:HAMP domain-containing histidine kinase [Bacteroidota bacterium]